MLDELFWQNISKFTIFVAYKQKLWFSYSKNLSEFRWYILSSINILSIKSVMCVCDASYIYFDEDLKNERQQQHYLE